jgi:hypothetical protein
MPGIVPGDAADHGAFETTRRIGGSRSEPG